MAQHKSAIKRIKTNEKRRIRNKEYTSRMKTAIKKVEESDSKDKAVDALNSACSFIDKLVSKGILKKNTAANKKSSLYKFVNSMN